MIDNARVEWGAEMLSWLGQSVRISMRKMRRRPLFVAIVISLLALVVGASTVVFSVLDAVVLQATPFPRADRLFAIRCRRSGWAVAGSCSVPEAVAVRDQSTTIDELAYYGYGPTRLERAGEEPATLITRRVSSSFFSTLQRRPQQGRWFLTTDDSAGLNNLVVLSHKAWRDVFEKRLNAVGSTIVLDGQPYVVCGIMPPDFVFPGSEVGAWVLDPLTVRRMEGVGLQDVTLVARIAVGADEERFRTELGLIAQRLSGGKRQEDALGLEGLPLRDLTLGSSGRAIWLLLLGTQCLLLIVAANLVVLLGAQGLASLDGQSVRIALGASRERLLVAHVTEQLLLVPPSLVLGLGFAAAVLRFFQGMGGLAISRSELAAIGGRAAMYGGALSFLAVTIAALVSFWPVDSAARLPLRKRDGTVHTKVGTMRMRSLQRGALATQLSLAALLIVTGGSATSALWRLWHLPLGFEPRDLLAVVFDSASGDSATRSASSEGFFRSVATEIERLPGVEAAATCSTPPLGGSTIEPAIPIEDRERGWILGPPVKTQTVSGRYFSVMKTPIVAGQLFADEVAPCTAIANESLADMLGGPRAAIGTVVSANGESGHLARRCIIGGVVSDARDTRIEEAAGPAVYFWNLQRNDASRTLLVRGRPAAQLIPRVRSLIRERDPNRKIALIATIQQYVDGSTHRQRLLCYQVLLFAFLGGAVSVLGVFGIVDYYLREGRVEIGIRLAVGAEWRHILIQVGREFLTPGMLGVAVGAFLSYGTQRVIAAWIREFAPIGPPGWALAVACLVVPVLLTVAWRVRMLRGEELAALLRAE